MSLVLTGMMCMQRELMYPRVGCDIRSSTISTQPCYLDQIVREETETLFHPNSRKMEDGLMFSRS